MTKLSIVTVACLVTSAGAASACIIADKQTDTFSNTCDTAQYVEYKTVGGGCYTVNHGAKSLKAHEKWHDPMLSQACGSVTAFRVSYAWCEQAEKDAGSCKLEY